MCRLLPATGARGSACCSGWSPCRDAQHLLSWCPERSMVARLGALRLLVFRCWRMATMVTGRTAILGQLETGVVPLGHRAALAYPGSRHAHRSLSLLAGLSAYQLLVTIVPEEWLGEGFVEGTQPSRGGMVLAKMRDDVRHELPGLSNARGFVRLQTVLRREEHRFLHSLLWSVSRLSGGPPVLHAIMIIKGSATPPAAVPINSAAEALEWGMRHAREVSLMVIGNVAIATTTRAGEAEAECLRAEVMEPLLRRTREGRGGLPRPSDIAPPIDCTQIAPVV
eukprot:NODE_672_length_1993_cov_32.130658_g621_i0.p2 GENE.NODE_672_length_1993_cov_32.130658_g621_i0~~NODE_672_length_1993_cov_32.130658_g621_i0.p2  ORF type:complete len:281 (+),score=37.15 NODE_672_length_1993_cov_32.130658_g621_i0:1099-1941(+)